MQTPDEVVLIDGEAAWLLKQMEFLVLTYNYVEGTLVLGGYMRDMLGLSVSNYPGEQAMLDWHNALYTYATVELVQQVWQMAVLEMGMEFPYLENPEMTLTLEQDYILQEINFAPHVVKGQIYTIPVPRWRYSRLILEYRLQPRSTGKIPPGWNTHALDSPPWPEGVVCAWPVEPKNFIPRDWIGKSIFRTSGSIWHPELQIGVPYMHMNGWFFSLLGPYFIDDPYNEYEYDPEFSANCFDLWQRKWFDPRDGHVTFEWRYGNTGNDIQDILAAWDIWFERIKHRDYGSTCLFTRICHWLILLGWEYQVKSNWAGERWIEIKMPYFKEDVLLPAKLKGPGEVLPVPGTGIGLPGLLCEGGVTGRMLRRTLGLDWLKSFGIGGKQ